jgi:acyl phosphate:glycerol-3-phosphate acyltransferase
MTQEMLFGLALGYLFGSIPFGVLLTRWGGKGDLREVGSGNIGATNVLRTGSKGLAALTLVLDCLKAVVAILVARALWGPQADIMTAAGAMLGHLYPVWLGFKGGKGVATMLGVLIALFPLGAAIYAAIWLLLFQTTRISSMAGLGAAVSAPISELILGTRDYFPLLLGFALLVLWKHRDNIARLRAGTEPKFGKAGA